MPEQGAWEQPDDEPESEDDARPLPSPDDRLWRHPAEVAADARAHQAAAIGTAYRPRGTTSFAVAAVAALGGGLLITGLWLAIGSTDTPPVGSTAGDSPASDAIVASAEPPAPLGSATVEVRTIAGRRLGVGVALTDEQEILTAADVEPGETVEVVLTDGSTDRAEVVGHDALTGLTALRLTSAGVTATATPAADDSYPSDGATTITVARAGNWSHAIVEFDADSTELGQPVLDDDGAVIGIVTDLADGRTGYTPIDVVIRVARQLFTEGTASHPWLGIEGRDSTNGSGVSVTAVVPLGPAGRDGIAAGERITGVGDTAVTSIADLLTLLRSHVPGDTVVIEVSSGGSTRRLAIELSATDDA